MPDALFLSGPPGFTCLISFAPVFSFMYQCVLLSPYLCFVSFLYLDLYFLGDDAWISWGTFMQTRHLCILIHI